MFTSPGVVLNVMLNLHPLHVFIHTEGQLQHIPSLYMLELAFFSSRTRMRRLSQILRSAEDLILEQPMLEMTSDINPSNTSENTTR